MIRHLLFSTAFLGLAISASGGPPNAPASKSAPKGEAKPAANAVAAPPEFDVGFLDGSNVKVVVLEPEVAVTTKYGKLTVPLAELKRVELGFRYPEGVEAKLETAIERLAAPGYADREEAARQIHELKQYAGPMLKRAARSSDAERRARAAVLLKAVREAVPAERVDAKDYDLIETAEFDVRGRLDADSFKVRTKQFGEAVVKVAEVKQFHSVAASLPTGEVTLDAAAYSKANWSAWLDTATDVEAGAALAITCTGRIDQWPQEAGKYMSGPAGNGNQAQNQQGNIRALIPNQFGPNQGQRVMVLSGAVIGKIGQGQPFVVGASLKVPKSPEGGRLFLQIAPSHWGNDNATGAYKVQVKVGE